MSKSPTSSILYLTVTALMLLALSGCPAPASKHTAEEAGYLEEVNDVLAAVRVVGVVQSTFSVNSDGSMTTVTNVPRSMGARDWPAVKAHLSSIIPPDALNGLHTRLVAAVVAQEELDAAEGKLNEFLRARPSSLSNDPEFIRLKGAVEVMEAELVKASALARIEDMTFLSTLEARTPLPVNGDELGLVYKPPGSPVGVGVTESGKFSIEISPSVNTPIGSFSPRVKEAKGVKKLIIRSDGKERYFKLDRPFKLFLPTDYGVEVSGDGSDSMTIEVKARAAQ